MSEPNYHNTKFFTENFLAIEMRKTKILMNKPVYLVLSIWVKLYCGTLVWYPKPKYSENARLCYMDMDSFIVYVKTDDMYKDNAEDVETRFDTSNYELDKPLLKEKKKFIALMKDKLGGKSMKKFVTLTKT